MDREGFINGNLYLDKNALGRDGINIEEVERVAGEAAMTVPGVRRYFTRTQLERASVSSSDPVARRVLHGFHLQRSGDVVVIHEPYHLLRDPPENPDYPRSTATHGSPYSYDTHVPLIIMGTGVKAGRYLLAAAPSDIAPTLAALLGVQSPSNATGRVLTEGLELRGARAANPVTVGAEDLPLRRVR